MKSNRVAVLAFVVMLLPSLAMAHGSNIDKARDILSKVLGMFEDDESGAVRRGFSGVKTWVNSDGSFGAKIYVTQIEGKKEIVYSCAEAGHDAWTCNKTGVHNCKETENGAWACDG